MEIRKSLLAFRTLIESIKQFKEKIIPSADELASMEYKDDMKTLATRYLVLTQDAAFKAQLQELYYLETVIMQIRCINEVDPIFFLAKPSVNNYVYVRTSFLGTSSNYQMARSLGKQSLFNKTPRQLSMDPKMVERAKRTLRRDMKDNLILEEYKLKYHAGRTTT